MLGADVIRSMQQGKPRIDLKLDRRRRRQPAADRVLSGVWSPASVPSPPSAACLYGATCCA
jgi:hypothetical protein